MPLTARGVFTVLVASTLGFVLGGLALGAPADGNVGAGWMLAVGFLLLGLFFGWLFAFSGYGLPRPAQNRGRDGEELRNSIRFRNVMYLLGGAVAALVVNWRPFLGDTPQAPLFTAYLVGAVIGILVSIAWSRRELSLDLETRNQGLPPTARLPKQQLLLDYLHYGYDAYTTELAKAVELSERELDRLALTEHEASLGPQLRLAATLAGLRSLLRRGSKLTPADSRKLRDELVETVKLTLFAFVGRRPRPSLTVTLMVFRNGVGHEFPDGAKFVFGDPARYTGYLGLIDRPNAQILLPIDKPYSVPDTLLPGAPAAFAKNSVEIMNLKRLSFGAGVPKETQDEIAKYFRADIFRETLSITSVPFGIAGETRGIVNIESNQPDLFGDESLAKRACSALHPILVLLSIVCPGADDE